MNPVPVLSAILTRLQADATLYAGAAWTAALAGGAWAAQMPNGTLAYPYVVYDIQTDPSHAFTGQGADFTVTFEVIDESPQGLARISVILDRLIGNAMLATGTRTVPTYGLDRHTLVLPANTLNAVSASLVSGACSISAMDEKRSRAVLSFKGSMHNLGVNP